MRAAESRPSVGSSSRVANNPLLEQARHRGRSSRVGIATTGRGGVIRDGTKVTTQSDIKVTVSDIYSFYRLSSDHISGECFVVH